MTDDYRFRPSGPLAETTLTCPECAAVFTASTRDRAQERRYWHVREGCITTLGVARRLKQHDAEATDDD